MNQGRRKAVFLPLESCSNYSHFACAIPKCYATHTTSHSKTGCAGANLIHRPFTLSTATYRDDCTAKKGALELSESPSQEASEAICSYRRLTTVLFMFVRRVWQQSPFNIKLEGSRAPWCYSIVDVALIYNMANG